MERVLCSCFVDYVDNMQYDVTVWGQPPYDHRRVYSLKGVSDDAVAKEGLRLFEDEMQALYGTEDQ